MLENIRQKLPLLALTGFLFLMSANGWMMHRFDLNISIGIYFSVCILVLIYRAEFLEYLYERLQKNIFDIDFLILAFLLLHFVVNQEVSITGISFGFLFIFFSSLARANPRKNREIISHSLFISAIISSLGVLIGLVEGMIGNSIIFTTIQPPNYPSPILKIFNNLFMTNWVYQISGFQLSINYTAYILIGGLASTSFMEDASKYKNFFISIFILALILCQAKIGYLFLSFLGIKVILNSPYKFLILVSCFYLILTHLTINHAENVLEITHYFKSQIFSWGSYDFYVSFFSWLKISAFEYLVSVNWFFGNYDEFIKTISADPHSFWVSLILIGGPVTALLMLIKFIKVEKGYREINSKKSALLFASFYALIVETIVWDAVDAPIFWIIFLTIPMIIPEKN
jgi:hypothetical protein